jgi:hypothetical protein
MLKNLEMQIDKNQIIVSTYAESMKLLEDIADEYQIIWNEDIGFSNNLERQIFSTNAGIQHLEKFDFEYLLKIRVDQAFSNPNMIQILLSYYETFEVSESAILFSSLNSYTYRPFGSSDMFTFGKKEAIKEFWEIDSPDGYSVKEKNIHSSEIPWLNSSKVLFNEVFLNIRYDEVNNFIFTENLWIDSQRYLGDYVIVIDARLIGHTWEKWNSEFPSLQERTIHNQHIDQNDLELDFQSWFLGCSRKVSQRPSVAKPPSSH